MREAIALIEIKIFFFIIKSLIKSIRKKRERMNRFGLVSCLVGLGGGIASAKKTVHALQDPSKVKHSTTHYL